MSAESHRAAVDPEHAVACAVVTVSDSRTEETDASGGYIKQALRDAGHTVEFYRIVPDDGEAIRAVLLHLAGRVEVVVTTGGTGISARDTTVEVADRLVQKALPGFGELFRMKSFDQVGAAAMLSRAMAGLYGAEDQPAGTLLFCCPGAEDAVALAVDELIVPDLRHLAREVVRMPEAPPSRIEFPVDQSAT